VPASVELVIANALLGNPSREHLIFAPLGWSHAEPLLEAAVKIGQIDPLNFDNIDAQRNLNDKGKALAKAFGDAIRQVGIPVGKVYTSRYNRAYETAVIAGFKDIEKTADLTEGGLVVSPKENDRRVEAFHKMLGTSPKPGTNTILITHKPNIIDGLGKDWFDVREGEASVFRPENGGYALIARIQMDAWSGIALAAK
jgi:histidine phosphatase superfamily protein (branch 1)